jgi:membrane-associated phospholipid phosphatase
VAQSAAAVLVVWFSLAAWAQTPAACGPAALAAPPPVFAPGARQFPPRAVFPAAVAAPRPSRGPELAFSPLPGAWQEPEAQAVSVARPATVTRARNEAAPLPPRPFGPPPSLPLDTAPVPTLSRLWRGTLHLPGAAVKHWKPTLAVVLTTAALIAFVDRPVASRITNYDAEHDAKSVSNGLLLIAEPAEAVTDSLLLRREHNAWRTLVMGAFTIGYATAAMEAMKLAAGRERPYLPGDSDGAFFAGGNSFPSGHAMASFTVASFLAHRYPRHKWVAWVGYGLATAVATLRVTAKEHFPADVFFGGVMGFAVGRCAIVCR